jgi:CRP/FNR family cyclic AMP-dependent transcriptional regulator
MDTTGFFDYPSEPHAPPAEHGLPGFLQGREDDWATLLDHSETRLFHPGETVLAAGERDRALYLLVDGWLRAPSGVIHPITTLGEAAFLDGSPRAVTVMAMSEGEMLRLSFDGFEALAARNPALGRDILLDLGRILSARLRQHGETTPGWTG